MSALALDQVIQAASALIAVLGLVLVAGWALRLVRQRAGTAPAGRLRVAESLPLDARHRLVRIVDGDREHLVVLGPTTPVRLASRPAAAPEGARP